MAMINSQLRRLVNSESITRVPPHATVTPMAREVKFTPELAEAMGDRLRQLIVQSPWSRPQFAIKLGVSTAMLSKMINQGGGSLAAWAKACELLNASLDYVVLARFPTADPAWVQRVLRAGMEAVGKEASGPPAALLKHKRHQ